MEVEGGGVGDPVVEGGGGGGDFFRCASRLMGTKCSQQQEASVRRGGEAENVLRVSFPREVKILKDEFGVGGGINFRLLLSGGRRISSS